MVNIELIELQNGCMATCVVIQNEDYAALNSKMVIDASISDSELLLAFKKIITNNQQLNYLVITEIDEINYNLQDRYFHIVKDREFCGYNLPKDIVIVLTVKDKESLKKINPELYNLCVVAF